MQGRLKEGKEIYAFFGRCAEGIRQCLRERLKLWEFGVREKMWRVIKTMYEYSKRAVFLDGEWSEAFEGVAQGCSFITNFVFRIYQCVLRDVRLGLIK